MSKLFCIISIVLLFFFSCNSQSKQLNVGDTIPMFQLKDQDGKTFFIRDSLGKKVFVIFFYPKDESAVCTREACAFRDSSAEFTKAGAVVLGINQGSIESHKKFSLDDNLPYELLSDPDETVIKQFGVNGAMMTDRITFITDKRGKIVYKYSSMLEGKKHAKEALEFVQKMKMK